MAIRALWNLGNLPDHLLHRGVLEEGTGKDIVGLGSADPADWGSVGRAASIGIGVFSEFVEIVGLPHPETRNQDTLLIREAKRSPDKPRRRVRREVQQRVRAWQTIEGGAESGTPTQPLPSRAIQYGRGKVVRAVRL